MVNEIIQQIKEGDREAFSKLYEKYAARALRVAIAVTKNRSSAADAVQEAFVKVYRSINSYNQEKPFEPWFYKILVNECNRSFRGSRIMLIDECLKNIQETAIEDQYKFEEYETLYKAISSLKDIYRIPLILKYLNDMSEGEVAQTLDISLSAVKSRLFKGRNKLKKYLQNCDERSQGYGGQDAGSSADRNFSKSNRGFSKT